jgi:hypothetical protein
MNGKRTVTAVFALDQYAVTSTPLPTDAATAGGSLQCTPNNVDHGTTTTCTAIPLAGHRTLAISGCGGSYAGAGSNQFTTASITAACTVSATFEKLSYAVTSSNSPGGNMSCTPSLVLHGSSAVCTAASNAGHFTQSITAGAGCSAPASAPGMNDYTTGPATAACTVAAVFAPLVQSFTGTTIPSAGGAGGTASASFTGGGPTCRFDIAGTDFVAAPANLPAGLVLPQGLFQFKLVGCTPNATVTMSVTWPQPVQGLTKWGKATPGATTDSHFAPNNLVINGTTTTYTVQDGALGDDDWQPNGIIVDPAGPVPLPDAVAIPALQTWALALLSLLAAAMGARVVPRRSAA